MSEPWWKNTRGELFVLGQFIIFGLVAFGPRHSSLLPGWSYFWQQGGRAVGALLLLSGFLLAMAGTLNLGRKLTPFIIPQDGAVLLERGAYRIVRHPIYSGILQLAFGWGLVVHGWLTLGYALLLLLLFDRKARREEQHLHRIFPGYAAYCRRVRRLIPFIY